MAGSESSSLAKLTELDVLKSIDQKLEFATKLLMANLVNSMDENAAIYVLAQLEVKYSEIARYFRISENAVKMRIRDMRTRSSRGTSGGKKAK